MPSGGFVQFLSTLAFVLSLFAITNSANASGVERGSVQTEVVANSSLSNELNHALESAIRARCDLSGVVSLFSQAHSVELVLGRDGELTANKYRVEYTLALSDSSRIQTIVAEFLVSEKSSLEIQNLISPRCR